MEDTKTPTDDVHSEDDKKSDDSTLVLRRQVGFVNGVSLIVGTIIGSGIFISPKGVFRNAGSVGLGLLMWMTCGILSTCGALCYSELGTMIPRSGGEFPILLEAFGPVVAYLFAWTATVILKPSSLSLLSLTFAKYALAPAYGDCADVPETATKLVAAVVILTTVFVNCYSVKLSTKIVTFFGIGKIISLVIVIIGGIVWLVQGNTQHFSNAFDGPTPGVREISLGLYQGLWAFDGWNQLNYIVEELKNPYKTLPRAIITSMAIVTGLYLLTNVAYLAVMSLEDLLQSPAVGATFGEAVLGVFVWIIPLSVTCSVFGTCLGSCFTAGRISYAAAREGHFNQVLSMIHVTKRTPSPSVILNGIIALVMLIPNDFDSLINYYSFATWVFYFLTASSLIYFRYKMPDRHRPLKVPIFIPIIFCAFCLYLIIAPIVDDPQIQYLLAVCTVLFGLVFYIPFVHFKVKSSPIRSMNKFLQKLMMVTVPDDTS